ncbi:peptidase m50 : Peptidase M50 OS=Cyclobacterium marinum (strain ATCC 25205 / DSM 745) GN=Cycma_4554 PE=4 SV=1: Peptidase_M50 [Gemmataceae bacterium]|nr:peptidase m50 : Peptidase M50 OS=Cyclobacterium marinum (strain ATCC 25205 / DSM 745) GN=Cycma_4554 PE=4 SV=1: Peptidase_M50 [Gemmataceae bacterium]VTT99269.1 peptidase m50 : Peptidase M50 OS=Cyclobacterium marinum (strain ATCC 25205 / DSM 745) GN=Cycma_4554 PE=4 SV=1: Peptidase_M50 [Gemmataceae bacterium]
MFGSLKLGKVFGIDLYVHGTFWLLPLFVSFSDLSAGAGLAEAGTGLALVFAVFACIALHELGHALAARYYGIGTRDITLYPLGGIASLERMPERPGREIAIALAGPAVNIAIALALFSGLLGASLIVPLATALDATGLDAFLSQLFVANVVLAAFNLLPCFPMDGGRVLRALLASRMSRVRATEIAVGVGSVVAGLFILVGLLNSHFGLIAVAVMVWLLGQGELAAVRMRARAQEMRERVADWFEGPPAGGTPADRGFTGLAWDDARRAWVQYDRGRAVRVIES